MAAARARAGTPAADHRHLGHGPGHAGSSAPRGRRRQRSRRRPRPRNYPRPRPSWRPPSFARWGSGRTPTPPSNRFSGPHPSPAASLSGRSAGGGADPDVATPGPGGDYAQRMQTTRFADAAPVPHRFHVHYTIKKGTIFPCTPAQPISSSLPGPVRCTADQDVWSMDGTTILLPRGTQVNGTVERGLTTGEERLFLVWTDALTPRPDLLAIPLDSPAADELGQTGAPGDVNDHLWKRIRTALLLSAVEFAGTAGTAALQQGRNNTYLNFNGVAGTANSLAQMAFGRDLNIPPTLYRGPGQPLTVYVNHYIDLYRFYENRVR